MLNPYPVTCIAPVYIAEAMLKAEGFTHIEYRLDESVISVGPGKIDLDLLSVCPILIALDANSPVVTLATMHLGSVPTSRSPAAGLHRRNGRDVVALPR